MASDDTMTIHSSIHEDDDDDDNDHHQHQYQYQYRSSSLSRLSICTNSSKHSIFDFDNDDDDDDHGGSDMGMSMSISMSMSRLSIDCSDGDADEELSDDKEVDKGISGMSSDSDKEPSCFSLPVTRPALGTHRNLFKEYVSENEAEKGDRKKGRKNSGRRVFRERRVERDWENRNFNGENECLVITRPKGGKRSLCMDLEEVKACRDLGFELEHERVFELQSRISISGSTVDTSSGGNSPITNWRISSPGDDPRDVKARLKVWAQAVALASTSRFLG